MFNSLRYTKVLEEAGVPRQQAEAHIGVFSDMMGSHFATTQDMKDLRIELAQEMKDLRIELTQKMDKVDQEVGKLRLEIQNSETRLALKLGTIVAAAIGVAATVMTLVIKLA